MDLAASLVFEATISFIYVYSFHVCSASQSKGSFVRLCSGHDASAKGDSMIQHRTRWVDIGHRAGTAAMTQLSTG
jgi:hypothetical protein